MYFYIDIYLFVKWKHIQSKHIDLSLCWLNVLSLSATLAQHKTTLARLAQKLAYLHTCVLGHSCILAQVLVYLRTHALAYLRTYASTRALTYLHKYLRKHLCKYLCTCASTCTFAYLHTNASTCALTYLCSYVLAQVLALKHPGTFVLAWLRIHSLSHVLAHLCSCTLCNCAFTHLHTCALMQVLALLRT